MKTIKIFFAMLFFFAFTSSVISQDQAKTINSSFDHKIANTSDYVYGQGYKITKHWIFKDSDTDYLFNLSAKDMAVNSETPSNLSVIDNLYKAFSVGDIPTVLGCMDANIVWNEAEGNSYADGNPYIGPEAVLNGVFARVGADFEYFHLADIKLHDMSNDQVLATLRYKAKIKENGAIFDAQVAHLWTLKDGKVIAFQQYVDTKKLADAFGE
ncbi:MAG: nuclear transport factor 2 family protein [Lutibacter sp.]|nr:nuclear transport factor 2 family protein [Lutibacter sp.]MDT8416363.1 nuclear transport factor 2 family protein [Lutibacter sp.]